MSLQLSTGPALPYDITGGAMASSPDGNGVILFGGYKMTEYPSSQPLDSIFELKFVGVGLGAYWTTLTTKLQHPRWEHVVIPLVMDTYYKFCNSSLPRSG